VRRGLCRSCRKAFTILPDWLAPSAHYTLRCRQQACERIATGDSLEQAAPHCQDPQHLADPATVRRWAQRRLLRVWWWFKAGTTCEHFLPSPTILAWDLSAFCRNLALEANAYSADQHRESLKIDMHLHALEPRPPGSANPFWLPRDLAHPATRQR